MLRRFMIFALLLTAVAGFASAQGLPTPHYVQLTWKASTSSNVTGYNLYVAQTNCPTIGSPTGLVKLGSTAAAVLTYDDHAALAGVSYCYIVRADNGFDESVDSNTTQALIPFPPAAPSGNAAAVKK